jgi:hypothetical protein
MNKDSKLISLLVEEKEVGRGEIDRVYFYKNVAINTTFSNFKILIWRCFYDDFFDDCKKEINDNDFGN